VKTICCTYWDILYKLWTISITTFEVDSCQQVYLWPMLYLLFNYLIHVLGEVYWWFRIYIFFKFHASNSKVYAEICQVSTWQVHAIQFIHICFGVGHRHFAFTLKFVFPFPFLCLLLILMSLEIGATSHNTDFLRLGWHIWGVSIPVFEPSCIPYCHAIPVGQTTLWMEPCWMTQYSVNLLVNQ